MAIQKIRKCMDVAELQVLFLRDNSFTLLLKYFLQCHGNEKLQHETCWILTNIAAGSLEHTQAVRPSTFTLKLVMTQIIAAFSTPAHRRQFHARAGLTFRHITVHQDLRASSVGAGQHHRRVLGVSRCDP